MPFLLVEILNFQGSTHLIGVGSFSYLNIRYLHNRIISRHKSVKIKVQFVPFLIYDLMVLIISCIWLSKKLFQYRPKIFLVLRQPYVQ